MPMVWSARAPPSMDLSVRLGAASREGKGFVVEGPRDREGGGAAGLAWERASSALIRLSGAGFGVALGGGLGSGGARGGGRAAAPALGDGGDRSKKGVHRSEDLRGDGARVDRLLVGARRRPRGQLGFALFHRALHNGGRARRASASVVNGSHRVGRKASRGKEFKRIGQPFFVIGARAPSSTRPSRPQPVRVGCWRPRLRPPDRGRAYHRT